LELILVAAKGSPVLASSTQVSSIFSHAVVPSKHLIHPNEKPVGLLENIARNCSYSGSLGVDPFGGSGAFAEMCVNLKRHYVVIEREADRYKKIQERLRKRKVRD
jgi:DNA modification methylase